MSRNVRVLKCEPADVFAVLANGWLYPSWVVGASRMRDVDESWPSPGARLHHSFGVWPALIDDMTVSEEWDPPYRSVVRARGWPVGEARVTLEVKPRGAGECVVRIQEEAVSGPATLVPAPLMDLMLHWRNAETLHRLAYLAEGMAARSALGPSTAEREAPSEVIEDAVVVDYAAVEDAAVEDAVIVEDPEIVRDGEGTRYADVEGIQDADVVADAEVLEDADVVSDADFVPGAGPVPDAEAAQGADRVHEER